jgi:hypothetical protein
LVIGNSYPWVSMRRRRAQLDLIEVGYEEKPVKSLARVV